MKPSLLQKLKEYFDSLGPQFDLAFATISGTYYPASISHIEPILTQLLKDGKIKGDCNFLDTGCGDGRIVALGSLLGFKAVGIELNKTIFDNACENIDKLITKKILREKPILIHGDALDLKNYKNFGVDFREFSVIFNFNTLPYEIIDIINLHSPQNTIFIFNSIKQELESRENMELLRKIYLKEIDQIITIYKKNL